MSQSNYSSKGPNALTIIDQSIFIIKENFSSLFWRYYLGTLPFLFVMIFYILDMTKGAFAASYLFEASLGVAITFLWMKFWHIKFCHKVLQTISGDINSRIKINLTSLISSLMIQSIGLFIIPLSLLTIAGYPYAFAFFQYALIIEKRNKFRELISSCIKNTVLWPLQNSIIFSILLLVFIFIWINLITIISLIPTIAINIFGLHSFTYFSNSGAFWITFILSVIMISWSILDPIIKTVYCLRYYYGMSIKNGKDLIVPIKNIKRLGIYILFTILIGIPTISNQSHLYAKEKKVNTKKEIQEFNEIVDNVIKQPIYSWRLPQKLGNDKKELSKTDSFIKKVFTSISNFTKKSINKITSFLSKIKDWFAKFLPKDKQTKKSNKRNNSQWIGAVNKLLLGLFIALLIGAIIWAVLLYIKDLNNKGTIEKTVLPSKEIDLEDHNTTAEDLPADEWFQLAIECLEKGNFRHAIRAAYLSVLANLGENGLLTLERHRSNREYISEISIKGRQYNQLIQNFKNITNIFEMVWYGNREAKQILTDEVLKLNKDINISVQS